MRNRRLPPQFSKDKKGYPALGDFDDAEILKIVGEVDAGLIVDLD
jgi:hypothetical protein